MAMVVYSLFLGASVASCYKADNSGTRPVHEFDTSAGTVDPSAGLVWQVGGNGVDWESADELCTSIEGNQWRLPNIDELRSVLRTGVNSGCAVNMTGGECGLTEQGGCLENLCDNACRDCITGGGPGQNGCYWEWALGGECGWTWSSSECPNCPGVGNQYWGMSFTTGYISFIAGGDTAGVLCVRNATQDEIDDPAGDSDENAVLPPGTIYGIATYNEGEEATFRVYVSAWDREGNPAFNTTTYENGQFELSVPPGNYTVEADSRNGYIGEQSDVEVISGQRVRVVIDMI